MTPEKAIQDAMRVENFLKDEAIGGALSRMERRYFEEFKAAQTADERNRAWAKAHNLDDFLKELRIVISTGELEALTIAQQAKRVRRAPNPKE